MDQVEVKSEKKLSIKNRVSNFLESLSMPVDVVNLGCFRILFGALLVFYVYRYRSPAIVDAIYLSSDFHFSHTLFSWLHLPQPSLILMRVVTQLVAVSALFMALGLFFRLSTMTFLLSFGYMFLLEKTHYNNHYYLILLISFLFLVIGPTSYACLDTKIFKKMKQNYIQYWQLFLFQIQFCLVFFFGGIAKLDTDWMSGRVTEVIFEGAGDGFFFITAIGGLLVDFIIAWTLFSKSNRKVGIFLVLLFSCFVKYYLNVGIFPYLLMFSCVLFMEPENVRRFLNLFKIKKMPIKVEFNPTPVRKSLSVSVSIFIGTYLLIQVLTPMRHLVIAGPVNWNQNGDRFAWRMFSQENVGHVDFFVTDLVEARIIEVPRLKGIDVSSYIYMTSRPDMILQYAKYLHEYYKGQGMYNPIVTVNSFVSLNGRPFSLFMNPELNLAHNSTHIGQSDLLNKKPSLYTSTQVQYENMARFYSAAYQLAVIENEGLIKGDHPLVLGMQDKIDQLIGAKDISPFQISDLTAELQNKLYVEYGRRYTIEDILTKLYNEYGPFKTIPSVDEALPLFI